MDASLRSARQEGKCAPFSMMVHLQDNGIIGFNSYAVNQRFLC